MLPGIIVYQSCHQDTLSFYVSSLYVLAALIRLSWFNVDEENRQSLTESSRSYYQGLPVTTAALFLPLTASQMKSFRSYRDFFVRNRRSWALLTTDHFGPVVQTEIGALIVGGISNELEEGRFLKGQEKGHFELAGSTIILLFQRGAHPIERHHPAGSDPPGRSPGAVRRTHRIYRRIGCCTLHSAMMHTPDPVRSLSDQDPTGTDSVPSEDTLHPQYEESRR